MGKEIILSPVVTINSVDLSDHISKATIMTQRTEVDVSTFGATYKEILLGLGDASITLDFLQDFDANSVDATLWPLSQSGSVFPVTVRPRSAGGGTVISGTNPLYTMSQSVLSNYDPLDGSIGAASITSVKFSNAGQTGVVRSTA
ncbi:MAG TPA: hypothetical protein VN803_13025 [Gemmatimonadales bacterium]|nr:hypothetical protein [Gemmatimonadales bacterium]